jgi:hypothetical protein
MRQQNTFSKLEYQQENIQYMGNTHFKTCNKNKLNIIRYSHTIGISPP